MKEFEPNEQTKAQITQAFVSVETFKPTDEQLDRKAHLGRGFDTLANEIIRRTAPGRAQSVALTKLEEAFGWVGRAIRGESR